MHDLIFERNVALYVIQSFLPMDLVMMVSWLSVWLKKVSSKIEVCVQYFFCHHHQHSIHTLNNNQDLTQDEALHNRSVKCTGETVQVMKVLCWTCLAGFALQSSPLSIVNVSTYSTSTIDTVYSLVYHE